MASLRKRGKYWYIVFSQRDENSKLRQKVYSLRTTSKRKAEKMKVEYGEQFRLGEIDPWGDWTPKKAAEQKRKEGKKTRGTLAGVLEEFLQSRSHVKDATLDEYRARLGDFVQEVGQSMPPRLVTAQDIRHYALKSDHSRATQRTYLRYCKMFFGWLEDAGYVEEDVSVEVQYPRKKNKVAEKAISEPQFWRLIDTFKNIQRHKIREGTRRGLHPWFKPLACVGFFAGPRRSEIRRLTWDHIDLHDGFLYVTDSKNGQERAVPLRKTLKPVLRAWHRVCGHPRRGLVFFKTDAPSQHTGRKFPLTPDNITKVFKDYARAANLPEAVSFHSLRHSCVTELLRLGMGIHEVADIVGHSSVEVTQIYEHLNRRDLKNKMDQLGI